MGVIPNFWWHPAGFRKKIMWYGQIISEKSWIFFQAKSIKFLEEAGSMEHKGSHPGLMIYI